jgi:hypothetical protein
MEVRIIVKTLAYTSQGHVIAQAVSSWHPTAAARLRSQVKSCVICGGRSGARAGFLRVLRFPLSILIPPTAPHLSSSSIIWGWYNKPIAAAVRQAQSEVAHARCNASSKTDCNAELELRNASNVQ